MHDSQLSRLIRRLALLPLLAALLVALLLPASPVAGADNGQPERIQFAPGSSAATMDGNLAPGGIAAYILRANEGQAMIITLTSATQDTYIAVSGADDGAQLLEMSARVRSWAGRLPSSQDYRIYVAAAGAGGPYSLRVEIPPAGQTGPATPTATPTSVPTMPTPQPVAPTPTVTMPPSGNVVYLTFDDGPHIQWTPQVLEMLARYNAKGTFFALGQNVANYPQLVEAELAAGHAVGNHTYSHRSLVGLSRAAFYNEVQTTGDLIGPHGAKLLRPPYGAINSNVRTYAAELGYSLALWNIDPEDWARPGAATIASRILSRVHSGSIVLMHDGGGDRSQSVAALEMVLRGLQERGYSFPIIDNQHGLTSDYCPSRSFALTP